MRSVRGQGSDPRLPAVRPDSFSTFSMRVDTIHETADPHVVIAEHRSNGVVAANGRRTRTVLHDLHLRRRRPGGWLARVLRRRRRGAGVQALTYSGRTSACRDRSGTVPQLRARQRARAAVQLRRAEGHRLPRIPSRHRRAHPAQAGVGEVPAREVEYSDIEKGYETSKGKYVMLTQEELESVEPGKSRTIDIEDFVELAEIDPIYFEKPYYLAPQKGAEKPYALLREAMGGCRAGRDRALRHAHQAVPRRGPRRRRHARARDDALPQRDPRHERRSTSRSAPRSPTRNCASRSSSSTA